MRLIFPKGSAEAKLRAEIARGGLGFNDALQIARGRAQTREECVRPQTPSATTEHPQLDLAPLFTAIITVATDAGYSASDISSAFNEAIKDHEIEDI